MGSLLVMDNAKLHHAELLEETRTWETLETQYNIHHLFLPPYSPFLNPIELVFNTVKYRLDSVNLDRQNLKQHVQEQFEMITEEECQSYFFSVEKFYQPCQEELPFSGKILNPDFLE